MSAKSLRLERMGDRHLREDRGGRLNPVSTSRKHNRVRLTASQAAAETPAGQHTLWMLMNLLSRQFGVVHEIDVVVPIVPLIPRTALFGAEEDLRGTLISTAAAVAGSAIKLRSSKELAPATVEVHVGAVERALGPVERLVRVLGHGWDVRAGDAAAVCGSSRLEDENPFGPYFAACVGAGEVFKHLRGLKEGKGTFVRDVAISLWNFGARVPAEIPQESFTPMGLPLPSFYLLGAGAVGQAAAAVLAASRVQGHATVVDRPSEVIDETNLNRYPLATASDVGEAKASFTAEFLRVPGLSVYAYDDGWPQYAYATPHIGQHPALQALEADFKYEYVLSCVDKNKSRHDIQNFWPRYIIGGSTDDLLIQVTGYDMRGPYECLKCGNPVEQNRTVEDIAEGLRALPREERRAAIVARGGDFEAIERHLQEPKCGQLGEQELQRFRGNGDQEDWSVGFVSVASGVLVAAQLVKLAVGGPDLAFPPDRGATFRYNFLNPVPRRSLHRRSENCDCADSGQREFSALWGNV